MFDSRASHIGDSGDRVFHLFDCEAILREKVFENTVLLEMTSKQDSLMVIAAFYIFICYLSLNKCHFLQSQKWDTVAVKSTYDYVC